ncbi:MAG TPA: META domain-containing protein [Puia sp.]|nr:META domain-containing protein [Puia sp.]
MKIPGVALLLLLACHFTGNATPDTTALGGRWYLEPVLPSDTAAGKIPWLDLNPENSRFTGNSGCNAMHGKFYFSKTDSSFAFNDEIFTARMACPGYNESAFLKSLKKTAGFRLNNGTLTLLGEDKTELSRWTRKPAKAPKALKT